MENRKVTSNCSIPVITEQTTLGELISALGPVIKAEMTPNSKTLREKAGNPIASVDRCVVYRNGYAVYDNETGRTVVWVPDCISFTYRFNKMKDSELGNEIAETFIFPDETLLSLPWPIAITLIGEHRIEKLAMRRKGDRKESKFLIRGDNEEGDSIDEMEEREDALAKEYFWREDQLGDDPEMIVIRKECRQRALNSMTEKQRQAFILYYRYGFTQREIAENLSLARTTVMHRLEDALKKVKKIYC